MKIFLTCGVQCVHAANSRKILKIAIHENLDPQNYVISYTFVTACITRGVLVHFGILHTALVSLVFSLLSSVCHMVLLCGSMLIQVTMHCVLSKRNCCIVASPCLESNRCSL